MAFLLQHLLSKSASRYPDRDAVIYKNRAVTYSELERDTNRLAQLLVALKIGKGDRVGLFFDRGIEAIVAACAVLKAGATYVPIDPASPFRRMSYIIEKAEIKSLLTVQSKLHRLKEGLSNNVTLNRIITLDGIDSSIEQIGSTRLIDSQAFLDSFCENTPTTGNVIDSDIAYILFTSGSTGNPKGVMISHFNSLTFVNSACSFFGIEKEDRFSNIAPLHFDMSIFDIFVAFKAGACVVIIPESVAIFPVKLAQYISEKKISVWNSVPSALTLIATVKNLDDYDLTSLRLILFAGELFPIKYLRILKNAIPGAKFCNMYGQTEANSSTYYWVDKVPKNDTDTLPIGRALPNFEVFALDDDGNQVCQPEQEGELFVRASTVALGYFGEKEKTEKAFVKNPLIADFYERVYRTGDLVRLDAEGNYVFLGRKDHMIKSRGYRIEIGEIETVLCNHPDIKQAVVIPIPDEMIGNRIIAYAVPFSPEKITKDELISYCFSQLPKYMMPENIEIREALPMTSSGKIDRQRVMEFK